MADPKPFTARQEKVGTFVTKTMAKLNTIVYRRSNGRFGGKFIGGAPVCVLTTTGRKSGEPRSLPLIYLRDGDDIVIVASKGGMSANPHWYLNLRDKPEVTIQIGADTRSYVARTATAEEKAALWPRLVAVYKGYESYQQRAPRDIPVVICTPS